MKLFIETLHAFGFILALIPQILLVIATFMLIPLLTSLWTVIPGYFFCYLAFKKRLDHIEPFRFGWGIPSFQGTWDGRNISLEASTSKSGTTTWFTYGCQPLIHFEIRNGKTGGAGGLHPPHWMDCPAPFKGHVYKTNNKPAFLDWLARLQADYAHQDLYLNYCLANLHTDEKGLHATFRCWPGIKMLDYAQVIAHTLESKPSTISSGHKPVILQPTLYLEPSRDKL